MALKKRYEKDSDIPEAMRSLYRKDGSGYVLDIDDGDDAGDTKSRIDEFRANNRKLMAELKASQEQIAALQKRAGLVGDRDEEEITTALTLLEKVNEQADRELWKAGKLDDVVARRSKQREAEFTKREQELQRKLEAEAQERAKARQIAADMLMERTIRTKLAEKKLRLRSSAEEDLMLRAKRDFRLEDLEGDPVPATEGGPDVAAWLDKMATDKAHWWEGGDGGGAKGNGGRVENGVRVVRRADLSEIEFGKLAKDIKAGTVRVVQ